jgi:hypothetical protein
VLPSFSFTRRAGASTLRKLEGRPAAERTEALRAGGRGGGAILGLEVPGDGAVRGGETGI